MTAGQGLAMLRADMIPDGNEGALGQSPLLSIVLLGALTLLPFVFMTTTSFVKISVVFSILRNALGTGQVPSGMVVSALAAILSLYVMAPVGEEMMAAAAPATARIDPVQPLTTADALFDAVELGFEPLRQFLERNAGRDELVLFRDLRRQSNAASAATVTEHDTMVVLPAFVITELSEAFQIGFLIFLPFLVIDMVVANVLLALGMQMLNPTQVSMPFKLLLFVLVNGWFLLSRALVLGYA